MNNIDKTSKSLKNKENQVNKKDFELPHKANESSYGRGKPATVDKSQDKKNNDYE